jgi:hypothetical protein
MYIYNMVIGDQPANEVRSFAYDNAQKYVSQEEAALYSVRSVNINNAMGTWWWFSQAWATLGEVLERDILMTVFD